MTKFFNTKLMKARRKFLRKTTTSAETLLWKSLRKKQFFGYKFYRQYSVGGYILDFYCPKLKLAIELYGTHHAEDKVSNYDKQRTLNLSTLGLKVIRFSNAEITNNTERVLRLLRELPLK